MKNLVKSIANSFLGIIDVKTNDINIYHESDLPPVPKEYPIPVNALNG